jgi:hypothetical protein
MHTRVCVHACVRPCACERVRACNCVSACVVCATTDLGALEAQANQWIVPIVAPVAQDVLVVLAGTAASRGIKNKRTDANNRKKRKQTKCG